MIELLAPAKTVEIGIEAIRHGADAVYIGADHFGARAAAGNSVEDIARLVEYAHFFRAKVYVTVNTILMDSELKSVEELVWRLYDIHVDALIVQDMGLLRLNLPPIALHASTQMDNRSKEKVGFLKSCGFEQVVLARELTLDEIREIHDSAQDVRLEAFVHGALCVSYSGQCYVSELSFGRSANRGECAQVCRMSFNLEDADGNVLIKDKHLLSLKDLCQLDALKDMLDAGISSLKIEGRLKDMSYVKNVTAAYSGALDDLCRLYPNKYVRSSEGKVDLSFVPDVSKSFNRGFTHYFLYGRNADIFSFDTPKALGEYVGVVKEVYNNGFTVVSDKSFSNGDGLCFLENGKLYGFRLNKVEGGLLIPLDMPRRMRPRTKLYRNFDKAFDKLLSKDSAERYIPVDVIMDETSDGLSLSMCDDSGCCVNLAVKCEKELARTHQSENIERQMSKLGGTGFRLRHLDIKYAKNWFLPSSLISEWRRTLVAMMIEEKRKFYPLAKRVLAEPKSVRFPVEGESLTYLGNVLNSKAEDFYLSHGLRRVDYAPEAARLIGRTMPQSSSEYVVMFCRHCLRFSLGKCPKRQSSATTLRQPLFLALSNGMKFRLDFDCHNCMMKVYGGKSHV